MTYQEAVQYLESFINYEKLSAWPYKESFKFERVRGFLAAIGNPQDKVRSIHIAGTKGKGSTACFAAHILKEAGFRTGLYTSPHLSDFRERIRILQPDPAQGADRVDFEGKIPESDLAGLTEELKPAIESYVLRSKYGPLSFFEIYTALAFVYFERKKTELMVLETGLGGRLDATNAATSLACAITPISLDHTDKLGNTLAEIASEKAGIIKSPDAAVICAPQKEEALGVIRERCRLSGARLYEVGKDIFYNKTENGFSVSGIFAEYADLKIRLLGDHQLVNASVAIGLIEALRAHNIIIGAGPIRNGLYNARWPGRCEVVGQSPLVVLDGAQNADSARALKEAVRNNFKYNRLLMVLGISEDKDIEGVCAQLCDLADEVVLTRAGNPRAASPETLAGHFMGRKVHVTKTVKEARGYAFSAAGRHDLVLVCGSLFVVGEFRDDKA